MKQKYIDIIKEAVDLCPKDVDVKRMRADIAIEEMAECQAAMLQFIRKPEEVQVGGVIKEIADIIIALEGYKIAHEITDEMVEEAIDLKTEKLANRMEKVKRGEVYY